jgi:hypothetical protein
MKNVTFLPSTIDISMIVARVYVLEYVFHDLDATTCLSIYVEVEKSEEVRVLRDDSSVV